MALLYAVGPDGDSAGSIYTINKTTGAATKVTSITYVRNDIATQPFERNERNPIPEPTTVALSGMALAEMGFAIRRRKH